MYTTNPVVTYTQVVKQMKWKTVSTRPHHCNIAQLINLIKSITMKIGDNLGISPKLQKESY